MPRRRAETYKAQALAGESESRRPDREIGALATKQHGVIGRSQLDRFGLSRGEIEHRLATGRLVAVQRGVYAVGHQALTIRGHWMAAVLTIAPAFLSHRSAAALWGVLPEPSGPIDVTAGHYSRARRSIRPHRVELALDEIAIRDGIPVTSVSRTLFDLAAVVQPDTLTRAIERCEAQQLTDDRSVWDLIERYPGRRGIATLREALNDLNLGANITDSELENMFHDIARRLGLERPAINFGIRAGDRWFRVDAAWPSVRVAIELDGRATHHTRAAFERDRERDRILAAHGWVVIRVTWKQLRDTAEAVVRDILAALESRRDLQSPGSSWGK